MSYRYPVYKTDGVATSGIKEWKTGNVTATVVENATDQVTWGTKGGTTWYVVKGADITLSKGAVCKGDVRLILADGAKLTATGVITPYIASDGTPSIQVSGDDNSLTIYGESTHSGQLIAKGGDYSAGIGGKDGEAGSNITINGGIVTATAVDWSAGIGGGSGGNGTNITINGGIVVATGGIYAAGIGGGESGSGSDITINGGIVKATGGRFGAGIGGGLNASGSNITINGGIVTATGGEENPGWGGPGDGIGDGDKGTGSNNIKVATDLLVKVDNNNPPTTVIKNDGTDLASSLAGKRYAIVESSYKGELTKWCFVISKNNLTYNGEAQFATAKLIEGIEGAGDITVTYKQNNTVVTDPVNAGIYDIYVAVSEGSRYLAFAETKIGTLTINRANLTASNFTYTAPSNLIWDGNTKIATVTFNEGKLTGCGKITVKYNGNTEAPSVDDDYIVSIDVAEGTNYNAATGLTDDAWKFTIRVSVLVSYINEKYEYKTVEAWEVRNADKQVTWIAGWYAVTGADVRLPKGAVCKGAVHLILADGAKLTATGETQLAGITVSGNENSLTIYGQIAQSGQLIATGGEYASGIGGGYWADGNNITINGGTVTANGGYAGAGIGGGYNRAGIYITINGGIVTATGGKYGAGIGGGENGLGSNIIINGGTVTANGGEAGPSIPAGAGIGSGGDGALASNIIVNSQCSVKADGKNPPTTVIENKGGDLASSLKGKRYAIVESPAKSDLTVADLVISSNSATYNGEAQSATVTFKNGITGAGQIVLTYKQNGVEVTPINVGTYDIYVAVTEGNRYNALAATKLDKQLTIAKADLTADNFTYKAPSNTYYNGKPREAKVELNSQGKTGVGTIIAIKYNGNTTVPSAAGDYTVSIDVAEGANYKAATGLTDDAWKFTIKGWPTPEPSNPVAVEIVKDGKTVYSVSNPEKVKYYKSDSKVEIIQNSNVVYSAENPEGVRYTHSYVDLGLPSGTLWAACNIGATKPEEFGNYYAWGDPRDKTDFSWGTYPYGNGLNNCTKYQHDGKWTLEPEDDMATVIWGPRWRVPTKADFQELYAGCDTIITTYQGVYGVMLISKVNGNSLFLPAAGHRVNKSLENAGTALNYWSSSVVDMAYGNTFWLSLSADWGSYSGYRDRGFSVRPVYDPIITLTTADFKLSTPTATYDGEIKEAEVSMADTKKSMPDNITIYYNNDKSLQPKDAGTYQVYIDIAGDNHYNDVKGLTSEAWKFTIEKATPTVDMFTYTAPSNLYDNVDSHEATVTFNNQNDKLTGMGIVTVKYNDSPEAPTALGDYAVSISVAEGTNYKAAEKLSDEAWKFTIKDFAPDGVEAIDLGLPSGLKWANVNIADPDDEALDDFFSWKDATDPDVATTNWGDNWRVPTKEDFEELINNCTWEWVDDDDDLGYRVTGKNGKSIFLSADGRFVWNKTGKTEYEMGAGYYWSSSIDNDNESNAYVLYFNNDNSRSVRSQARNHRCPVRPVTNGK